MGLSVPVALDEVKRHAKPTPRAENQYRYPQIKGGAYPTPRAPLSTANGSRNVSVVSAISSLLLDYPRHLYPPLITMDHPHREPLQHTTAHRPFAQTFFHGTKADLQIGELIQVGFASNFGEDLRLNHVYLSATLDAAVWGAELATGARRERIYLVEPTGPIEDDPNLTNKKFPGNPSLSYRSTHPLKVVGEVGRWQGHAAEQVQAMKDGLARLREQGLNPIEN